MRVLSFNQKEGTVSLQITNTNDLWVLETLLTKGCEVESKTTRMIKSRDGTERGERIATKLRIKVEKVSYEPFTDSLRATGRVVSDPDEIGVLGSYHTLVIRVGSIVTIIKDTWSKSELDELKRENSLNPLLIISVDYDEVALAKLWDYGVQILGTWFLERPGKQDEKIDEKLETQIIKLATELKNYIENSGLLVFAGPTHLKEKIRNQLFSMLGMRAKDLQWYLLDTSYGGTAGIKEAVEKVLEKSFVQKIRIGYEIRTLERLMNELLSDDGRALIGLSDVKKAIEMGVVKELIVSARMFKDKYEELIPLIVKAESFGVKIVFVSEHHEKGEELIGLGGIAAILRFPIKFYNTS